MFFNVAWFLRREWKITGDCFVVFHFTLKAYGYDYCISTVWPQHFFSHCRYYLLLLRITPNTCTSIWLKIFRFLLLPKFTEFLLFFFPFFSCSIRPHHLFCSENFLTTIHRKQIVLFFLCCCCLFWFRPFHKNPNPKINWINRDTEWNKKHART